MKTTWQRMKVPIVGIVGIFLITVMAFAIVNPTALVVKKPTWTITRNAVLDDAIFDDKVDLSKTCANIYDPVCGTDGVTYRNFCLARKAGTDLRSHGSCGEWVAD